jgi:AcrR family transcriptional regulator
MAASTVVAPHRGKLLAPTLSAPSEPGMGQTAHMQVAEIQRSRLLAAAVSVVDELGYSDITVTHITQRARVSRRTFYELFENREDCMAAMFEYTLEQVGAEVAAAGLDGLPWRERVRRALWAILCFLDREPMLARVCVVQSLRGDQRVLERRTEVLAELARVVDEGRGESARGESLAPLTAEGLVGAAHSIVYARLLKSEREPLAGLLGDLMAMVVLPYLGPEAARREQSRALPAPSVTNSVEAVRKPARPEPDPLQSIPMRVTYRTARVLERIAKQPGISNREVADQAGISDQGQMSKLLSRLEGFGLIANSGEGHSKGEPNAWALTQTGLQVAQSILVHTPDRRDAVPSRGQA